MAGAQNQDFRCPSIRGADRINFKALVKFRAGSRRAEVRVHDVSTEGIRMSVIHSLKVGDRLFVTLPGIESMEAEVAWEKEFELGCRFIKPLHPAVLGMLVGHS